MRRILRYYVLRFRRLQGHPQIIARGIAIGLFIGISPTIPLHTALLLALCLPLRASKIAAFFASFMVCNPLTILPLYYTCWRVGSVFFPGLLCWEKIQSILDILASGQGYEGFTQSVMAFGQLGFDATLVMLTGGFVLAIPVTLLGYYYSLKFFIKLRHKRSQRKYESCPD